MDYMRLSIIYNKTKKLYQVVGNYKLNGVTKNLLYSKMKTELNVKRIYTRKNSVVCII